MEDTEPMEELLQNQEQTETSGDAEPGALTLTEDGNTVDAKDETAVKDDGSNNLDNENDDKKTEEEAETSAVPNEVSCSMGKHPSFKLYNHIFTADQNFFTF